MSSPGPGAHVVFDLGFGDAGKGLLVDWLARRTGAQVVVRFNGGAQAGHNVVTPDGRHHTFAQLGAASFVPGARTFLSRHVVAHPTALLVEAAAFVESGGEEVLSRVRISERARIATPYHQAANRMRELARGEGRHGSCGVGVGETVEDALRFPDDAVCAGDLARPAELRRKLERLRERKRAELLPLVGRREESAREMQLFEERGALEGWIDRVREVVPLVASDELLGRWMGEAKATVFEGAQGVLLDERFGFHPHTTWSTCTPANALELVAELAPALPVTRIGVLRAHAVRHGPGPLPTEAPELASSIRDHNRRNAWQGEVRYGWFDGVLARYALKACGGVDALAITHVDWAERQRPWRAACAYEVEGRGELGELELAAQPSLEQQERLGVLLRDVKPILREARRGVVAEIGELCGVEPALVARGPTPFAVSLSNRQDVEPIR